MSRIYRYQVAKMLHPDYVILLVYRDQYITYNYDLEIIKYIKFKKSRKIFDKYKINYLVLDELDIIEKKEYDVNYYNKYKIIVILNKILKNIGYNLVKTSL